MRQTIECPDSDHVAILTYADMDQLDAVTRECARIKEQTKSTGDVTRVASVPLDMVQKFCDLKGITYQQFMGTREFDREFLNSAEVQAFRTWQGRL